MARITRITRWRNRRRRKRMSQGHGARRVLAAMVVITLLGLTVLLIAGLAGIMVAYGRFTRDLPEYEQFVLDWEQDAASAEKSRIYAWGGAQESDPILIYEFDDPLAGERGWLSLDRAPQSLIDATIAVEDPTFLTNPEIDFWEIARAVSRYMLGRETDQGAVPLVQQIVQRDISGFENKGVQGDRSLSGFQTRLAELLMAHRAGRSYSSKQIVEWFLNTTYYGNLAYGAEAAAQVYFDKSLEEISLAEAATLAAIPARPALNPLSDAPQSKRRQEMVLEKMAAAGLISPDAMAAAQFAPLQIAPYLEERFDVIAPHFARYVREELEARFGPQRLLFGGLRIFTTLDLEMQRQAECVAKAHANRLSGSVGADLPADERASCDSLEYLQPLAAADIGIDHNSDNAAVIILDAETAGIKAMVGSLNYWDPDIDGSTNAATEARHQPATALSPFVYLTALSQGYTASTMVLDIETEFDGPNGIPFVPENDDGRFHGPMRLREALGNGYHMPVVQVMSWVGPEKVLRTSRSMGLAGLEQGADDSRLSLARAGGEVTLLDLVYGYNVMNNMGVMLGQPRADSHQFPQLRTTDPVAILRVEDMKGDVLYAYELPRRREILTPQLAYLMNDMLSDRAARCAYFGCPNIMELPDNRPAAVSIGTSDDLRDAWAIGYTPQLVVGVWLGNSEGGAMRDVTGSNGAAPIWRALMSWAMQDESIAVWTQPPDLVEIAVCSISGLLATAFCPAVSELFIAGTQPTVHDNIYQEFAINRETDRLATIYTPPDLVEHKIFTIFPEQASEWALENGIELPPTEYDTITGLDIGEGEAQISFPTPFEFVTDEISIRGTASGSAFDYYRLAYFEGLIPADLQVIAENISDSREDGILGNWDVAELDGLYTLLLTVVNRDGSFDEVSVPLTIDNLPPEVTIQFPRPGRVFSADTTSIPIRVRATDNISVAQVRYYLDDSETPFATSLSSPFSAEWTVRSSGCFGITATAVDGAGNESFSDELPLCISGEGGG